MHYVKLLRLNAPTGIWLLLLPCFWSLTLSASQGHFPWYQAFLCTIGAVVMRSFGCIVNDYWDRDLDAHVTRTQLRPLASGAISPQKALGILVVLASLGLIVLLQFNLKTILWGIGALPLVIIYPLMKRWTYWPQLFLGLTFNWGIWIGWSALHPNLPPPWYLYVLYLGAVFWTLAYDTIYAFQDLKDDRMIGVKSSAQKLDRFPRLALGLFYTFFLLATWIAGSALLFSWKLTIMFLPLVLCIAWLVLTFDHENPSNTALRFRLNPWIGAWVWLSYCLGSCL
jgi:4-hydroxybenzoate polyprenyltransferase